MSLLLDGLLLASLGGASWAWHRDRQRATDQSRQADALLSLARAITGATSEAEVAQGVVREATRHVARGAVILLCRPEGLLRLASDGEQADPERVATLVRNARAAPGDLLDQDELVAVPVRVAGTLVALLVLVAPEPAARPLLDAWAGPAGLALARAREAELSRDAAARAKSEELRSGLLSSVSHDLRTPLASITGAASTLLDNPGLDPVAGRALLSSIHAEAARLERVVSNLLEATRLEAGAMPVNRAWVPVDEIVGAAFARVGSLLDGRDVHIDTADALAFVDPLLVEQALSNLLENAARHTPPGTPLDIRAVSRPESVDIEVADRGPGLPPGTTSRLFHRFTRGQSNAPGTGLGLAICQGVARAHGGEARAHAREGGGACFVLSFPASEPRPVLPAELTR